MTDKQHRRANEIKNALGSLEHQKEQWEMFLCFPVDVPAILRPLDENTDQEDEEQYISSMCIDLPALKQQVLAKIEKEIELLNDEFEKL